MVLSSDSYRRVPLVGISSDCKDGKNVVDCEYAMAVRISGGCPVLIPVAGDERYIDSIISSLDALIMTGGVDLDPSLYGETLTYQYDSFNAERDWFDIRLIRAAVAKGIPVFGICRGEQAVAIALGGSLWQDIPTQPGTTVFHGKADDEPDIRTHSIDIEPGTFLAKAVNSNRAVVNSCHHQAVRRLPEGFVSAAFSEDGIIEAIERKGALAGEYVDGGGTIIGVQFHPEKMVAADPDNLLAGIFKLIIAP